MIELHKGASERSGALFFSRFATFHYAKEKEFATLTSSFLQGRKKEEKMSSLRSHVFPYKEVVVVYIGTCTTTTRALSCMVNALRQRQYALAAAIVLLAARICTLHSNTIPTLII